MIHFPHVIAINHITCLIFFLDYHECSLDGELINGTFQGEEVCDDQILEEGINGQLFYHQ